MIDMTRVKFIKKVYLQSNSAEPSPPLGTILGNIGANAGTFCTQFNLKTKDLPVYLKLKTIIYIYDNRSLDFTIDLPSVSYFLNLLKFEKIVKVRVLDRMHEKTLICVSLYEVIKLSKLKFPHLSLEVSFKIIMGTINSMKLIIIR